MVSRGSKTPNTTERGCGRVLGNRRQKSVPGCSWLGLSGLYKQIKKGGNTTRFLPRPKPTLAVRLALHRHGARWLRTRVLHSGRSRTESGPSPHRVQCVGTARDGPLGDRWPDTSIRPSGPFEGPWAAARHGRGMHRNRTRCRPGKCNSADRVWAGVPGLYW